jgi:GNAT superfamily N-acetyltransferase
LNIINCTKKDYDQIISNIEEFWSDNRILYWHHPMFINEFGNTAFVVKERDVVCAYLFGFFSQTQPIAYVQLIAVRNNYKRKGLGRKLYEHFISLAKSNKCLQIKAITRPTNELSIAFHKSIGMNLIGDDHIDGIPVVLNYSGPGEHRVVFLKDV